MKTIAGVCGIIFAEANHERYFLLLHRVLNWTGWEFPKGRLEKNEKPEQAVLREIKEETGLKKLEIIAQLKGKLEFKASKNEFRSNDVFLVKADLKEKIKLQEKVREHDFFEWLPALEALNLLTFENQKKLLQEALKELEKL